MGLWASYRGSTEVRVDDPKLNDFRFLSTSLISTGYPSLGWARSHYVITLTTLKRLAHMTLRMERQPAEWTVSAARWYTSNLDRIPLPPAGRVLADRLKDRLMIAVHAYEAEIGKQIDSMSFGQMVGDKDTPLILYGPPTTDARAHGPSLSTLSGQLNGRISTYCWAG